MKLVIDIPEDEYEICLSHRESIENMIRVHKCFSLEYAVIRGTPLPKGHGRLGDLDKIKKEMQNYYDDCAKTSIYTRLGFETAMIIVEDANTIIEADTESEDKE